MFRKAFLVTALLITACGKLAELPTDPGPGGGEPIDPTATFTRVKSEIFTPTCAALGCHDRLGHQESQQLTSDVAYAQVVGHPSVQNPSLMRVAPGDPANSYLYRKITGAGISGDRMP